MMSVIRIGACEISRRGRLGCALEFALGVALESHSNASSIRLLVFNCW
ncbi:hypothetical protein Rrhod_3268 [Rhodococcus rhodnii LMG 5362]|uniref:Uncharacterized protein n=1 Tax=Rhodococcus rhodnii LMG 5362 TaxID=1273125 RepID=R7WJL8_9NOCA|nr:hypothetical protein Rrhod_3268 [Rhodococcus rhodnii LMG 5362]